MIENETLKPFYGKFPYRVKFYTVRFWPSMIDFLDYQNDEEHDALVDLIEERKKDIRSVYKNIDLYLKNMAVDYRTRNEIYTSYFLEDKEIFDYLCKEYADYIYEKTVPFREDMVDVYKKFPVNTEIRKYLYHGKYKYKMTVCNNTDYSNLSAADQSITEVMETLNVVDNGLWRTEGGAGHIYYYGDRYLYFETYEQVSYAALMFQHVKVKRINEAVLQSDVETV